ncbi:MAG: Xaa-Pro peptidase family protein [Alphaproteobacteria bacterium]
MPNRSDYPRFSDAEIASRHAKVHALMDEAKIEALLLYGTGRFAKEIYWLTDWPGSREAYVLFQAGEEPVVLTQLYNHVPMARVMSVIDDVRWAGANTSDTAADLIEQRGLGGKRVGLVGAIPYRHYLKYHDRFPGTEWVDLSGQFRMLRTIKSADEIERIRLASQLTDQSLEALAAGLKPGIKEIDLAALLEPVYLKAGGTAGIHFMTSMPMRAPNFQVPAQFQSNRTLDVGDCLITEISGAYWGYSGQIHRTFSLGEGPTPEWQDLHAAGVEAFETIEGLIKDGTTTGEVEEAADVIHRRGYSIYDDLLHGANQYPPIIQTKTTRRHNNREVTFRENMVVTIQPNVMTSDEKMGLQFGETVIVGKDGCEQLNHFPREWVVCG